MATSNIYVTPSTSLILIKSLAKPTYIYLSTFNVPDFQVNIRDTTGLQTTPINISTIGGAKFADNSWYYAINQPYGFINLSLRNSTIWQMLHTSGQSPASSAANVGVTSISTTNIGLLSTASKSVSSLTIENLETPNSIILTGPFIVGNLSTPGFVLLESTLNVSHNTTFNKSAYMNGSTIFQSSLSVETIQTLPNTLRILSTVAAGGSIYVSGFVTILSSLQIQSSLQVQTLFVEKSTTDTTVSIRDLLQTVNRISTLGGLTSRSLQIQNNLFVNDTASTLGSYFSTNNLQIGGNLTSFSTFSTLTSATLFSSLLIQSTLTIRSFFSTLSTATVNNVVSTALFLTEFLSSSTSFSTAGDFTVLSTLTVGGTLSTNETVVNGLFSVGTHFLTMKDISTFGSATVSTMNVNGSVTLGSLDVLSSLGIGPGGATIDGSVYTDSALYGGTLLMNKNLTVANQTLLKSNVGVASDIRVRGNATVLGTAYINSFNVQSYEVNDLQLQASTPLIALQASTLTVQSTLFSEEARLSYDPFSGDIVLQVSSPSRFVAGTTYAKRFEANYLSTYTLYTENIRNPNTSFSKQVEILTTASFPRGLSTPMVVGVDVSGNQYSGRFIGSAELLSNVPLSYANISAATLSASSIRAKAVSSFETNTLNATIESLLSMNGGLYFDTPAAFLSTGVVASKLEFIQPVNSSLLNITNTLFVNSSNRKVGILTSTPQYDLDISGSLYYSGLFSFANQPTTLHFSTEKEVVTFSTIFYSSIQIQDELQLPTNTAYPISNYIGFLAQATEPIHPLLLGERQLPYTIDPQLDNYAGIYTNSNYSTIDINYILFAYNDTRNVGIGTANYAVDANGNPTITSPAAIPSGFDLVVNGDFQGTEIYTSTMNITTKLMTSNLEMPMLRIEPLVVSTTNTITTSYSTYTYNNSLIINSTLQLFKDYTLQGSFHINKPETASYGQSLFCVYSDAYISSVTVNSLHATSILLGTQDL